MIYIPAGVALVATEVVFPTAQMCNDCALHPGDGYCTGHDCSARFREDGKDVIFKLVDWPGIANDFQPNTDLFGWYANIPTSHNNEPFLYKVINRLKSNSYCDVPILHDSKPTLHKEMVEILSVICCGLDESKVTRVALKECHLISPERINGRRANDTQG